MAGVAGQRLSTAPPMAEPPTVTDRSAAAASTRRSQVGAPPLNEQLRPASQPAQGRMQHRRVDRVDWGTEYNLVAEPLHQGHVMAPHPDSAVRKVGKHVPSRCMKDLWKMRDRCCPVAPQRSLPATESASSTALGLLASDVRFAHLGNSWSSFGSFDTGGSGTLTRSRTMRSPAAARRGIASRESLTTTSTSIGWRPGSEGADWSTAANFNRRDWNHGIQQSQVTNFYHHQKMSGMENAMRLIL